MEFRLKELDKNKSMTSWIQAENDLIISFSTDCVECRNRAHNEERNERMHVLIKMRGLPILVFKQVCAARFVKFPM